MNPWLMYIWWNTQEANWKNVFNIVFIGPAERGYHIKAFESSNCWMEVVHINGGTLCVQGCPKADFPTTNSISQIESSDPLSTNSWTRKGANIFRPKIILTMELFFSYKFYAKYSFSIYSIVSLSQFGFTVKAKDNLELTMPHRISSGCH